MVIIRLWGGLGNQLFQYAYGYSIAKKNRTELKLDSRFYSKDFLARNPRFTKQKPYILECPVQYSDTQIPQELNRCIYFYQNKYINRVIRIPKKMILPMPGGFKYIKETRLKYEPQYSSIFKDQVYLDGYWQCEKYFNEYRDDLVKQFTLVRTGDVYKRLIDGIEGCNSIAVHIRRGDYVTGKKNPGNLNPLPVEYYTQAIKQARETIENAHFFFFSNDIEWVKATLGETGEYSYISGTEGLDTLDEFSLMSKCKHMIIANSTFSWWAAWLNQNPEKHIWVPGEWFGNRDIIPEEWIRVK